MPKDLTYSVDPRSLISLFYPHLDSWGSIKEMVASQLPEPARGLLAHDMHMTVTVENFHNSAMDVKVLQSRRSGRIYCREILLQRRTDQAIVQYGIVRLDFSLLAAQVVAEIESESKPLGKILIEHQVLRAVHLDRLFQISAGPALCNALNVTQPRTVYGRTASILCDSAPAVELLEVIP